MHSFRFLLPSVAASILGLATPGDAQQPDSTVDVTVRVPGTIAGLQVRLVVNGVLARFRFPGEGTVTIPFAVGRTGRVRFELRLIDKPAVTIVDQWAAQGTLNGSGHIIWELQGIGPSTIRQWAALHLTATGGDRLDVLVAGRRAGRTPLTTGVAPGGPWEILWRHPDGTTACVTDLETGADQIHSLTCDPTTGSVRATPGNQPTDAEAFPSIRSRNR